MNCFVESYANFVTALLEMKLVVADFYQHCILNMGIVTQCSNQVVERAVCKLTLHLDSWGTHFSSFPIHVSGELLRPIVKIAAIGS